MLLLRIKKCVCHHRVGMARTLGTQFGYIFGCLELRVRDRNLTKNKYEHGPGTEDTSYASTIIQERLKEEHNIGLHFSYFH